MADNKEDFSGRPTSDLWCSDCKKPCDAVEMDHGIGYYDFHGRQGHDTHKVWVSTCCEAELLFDDPNPDETEDLCWDCGEILETTNLGNLYCPNNCTNICPPSERTKEFNNEN